MDLSWIANVEDPVAIAKILEHLKEKAVSDNTLLIHDIAYL